MAKEKKRAEVEVVNFGEALPAILTRVADVNDLASWKAAFPKIEFMEVDEALTGEPIEWEKRSPIEKAAYVAYMTDPDKVKIDYVVDIDGYPVRVYIEDCERAWYLWFRGCFNFLDESKNGEVPYEAKESLFFYAAQEAGDFQIMIDDRYSPDDLVLISFEMRAAKV